MVNVSQKESFMIKNLQSQEKLCIEKYQKNAECAKDPELKNLFNNLKDAEQKHYDSLENLLNGNCPSVNKNEAGAKDYNPTATYTGNFNQQDKDHDQFLCTDSIATEKYASSEYNTDLFRFGNSDIRQLLNNIETEEQNHAEMLYKYKQANQMTE